MLEGPGSSTLPLEEIREIIASQFAIEGEYTEFGIYNFAVSPLSPSLKDSFRGIVPAIKAKGLLPYLRSRDGKLVIRLASKPKVKPTRPSIHVGLFAATCCTVFLSGWFLFQSISGALLFTVCLLSILTSHELGHKLASRIDRIESSLPYFIPFIPPLGTFGAVIVPRDVPTNRDELFDIGFSGPLVGFFVTSMVALIGIQWSFFLPLSEAQDLPHFPFRMPLLLELVSRIRNVPPGYEIVLESTGFIALFVAWIGAFITMMNILPVWQLDGGHLARAAFGKGGHKIASIVGLVILALIPEGRALALLLFLLIITYGAITTPGPLDDVSPLSHPRKLSALIAVLIAALCVPIY